MRIAGDGASLEIEVADPEVPYGDGVPVDIAVESAGFSGRAFTWIWPDSFDRFLDQLGRLEVLRQGAAEVEGMSGADFWLRIYATDRAGHLAAQGRIGSQGAHQHSLTFGFDLDPGTLPWILGQFRRLKSAA